MLSNLLHLAHTLLSNPLFSGGAALGLTGGATYAIRKVPISTWAAFKFYSMMEVSILSDDPLFEELALWLDDHPYSRIARKLFASTRSNASSDERQLLLTPAPGQHLMTYRGRRIWLSRERKEAPGKAGSELGRLRETITLRFFGRDQRIVREFLADVRKIAKRINSGHVTIYTNSWNDWRRLTKKKPRALDSVLLPEGVQRDLVEDIARFQENRDWYENLGIPYRRGFLFYGPPGTGKSSFAMALAGATGLDIYVLSLVARSMSDDQLMQLMASIPERAIVLLEDIDAAFSSNRENSNSKSELTYSGLLNALDGVAASEGRLLFMTTNHPEKLDAALVRPGRVDRKVEFGYASKGQMSGLYGRFFPGTEHGDDFADHLGDTVTMARLQEYLLRHRDDEIAAFEHVAELNA